MYPLKLKAPIKDYIWGGTRLRDEFGKESELSRLAESWELSVHKDGVSIIENGDLAGMPLDEFLAAHPEASGTNCKRFEYFPVLIKLIDACDDLSVQVHPDNEYAQRVEGEYGKTEMWYIVDCDEGAELIYGFRENISKEEFRRAVEDNTLLEKVKRVPVKKGDVFFIKSGTLHAIGKGIVIAEIQQNSNTTYRVYDYGRVGDDGKPRELHIEKALDVTELKPAPKRELNQTVTLSGRFAGSSVTLLADCEYFTVTKYELSETALVCTADESSFKHLLIVEGSGTLFHDGNEYPLAKGTSWLLPAGLGEVIVKGKCSIINTEINIMEEI